ncbi:MAG: FkbM family methyltransferase, partial [Holosporaceae bacterium]|nr:FkbM family methyltransferase [Holosporaceae bacterium]
KNIGVLDKTGEAVLHYTQPNKSLPTQTNIGAAHIAFTEDDYEGNLVKKVKVTSLDESLPDLKNVDWLRMDIEGSELRAIQGARRIIESSPNLKIVTEWGPDMLKNFGNVSDFIDLLRNYGFNFYKIKDNGDLGDTMSKTELLESKIVNLVLLRDRKTAQP